LYCVFNFPYACVFGFIIRFLSKKKTTSLPTILEISTNISILRKESKEEEREEGRRKERRKRGRKKARKEGLPYMKAERHT
jgi:hypothetical protein